MTKEDGFYYPVEIKWTEGCSGEVMSDGLPTVQVAAPPEFQGKRNTWTPEHLYVAAVNACFMTTLLAIARNSKLEIVSFNANARGKLEKVEGGGFQITEIVLKPILVIRFAEDIERAKRVIDKTERSCLIANSIKTVVKVEPEIYHKQNPVYPCPPMPAGAASGG